MKPVCPDSYTRASFLARLSAATLGAALGSHRASAADVGSPAPQPLNGPSPGTVGRKVTRWDVITIGNLSRNRYWGESDAKAVRSAICTCTLVQGEDFCLLVDPSLEKGDDMARELDRRTGRKFSDVNAVFITHEHGDHFAGLGHFPEAKWFASREVASILNDSRKFPKSVEVAPASLFDALDVVSTPGHTMSHHSLRFDCQGSSVVVAGDAVPTRDFWRDRRGYFNCVDFELSARTMDKIAGMAELVVPGHDNYFVVRH